MSRLENTGKNAIWSTAAKVLYILLGLIGRYAFLQVLSETYLGINSLFASIVGVLSFADLGLSSAFTFCFYKPIAENDIPHIQALLKAFRKFLYSIAFLIGVIGIALIPFLRYLIRGGEDISDTMLVVYYLITLSNTVLGYWLMYKTIYVTAAHKAYKLTPFTIGANLLTVVMQIIVLMTMESYVAWLLCGPLATAVQYIIMNIYMKREFPELVFKKAGNLPEEDRKSILSNLKGIVLNKLGTLCVTQTDSIIISSMISIEVTGLLSNYDLIKTSILSIISVIQSAVTPGIGNLIASEDEKVQKNVLYTYMLLNYLMIGFAMCGVGILSSPFIALIFGRDRTVDELSVTLMCAGFYFAYQTHALNSFPIAAGRMILGAWVAFVEGIANLIISIAAVKWIGLPGVFVGTVLSHFVSYLIKPFPIFRGLYNEKPYTYFANTLAYFATTMVSYSLLMILREVIIGETVTLMRFAAMAVLTVAVFFGTAWLVWSKTKYGREVIGILRQALQMILKK